MKKLLIIVSLISSMAVSAQDNLRLGVHFDPIIGWFSPKVRTIDRDGMRPGFTGGLLLEAYFHDNYAFATGISIGMQGGNLVYSDSVSVITGEEDRIWITPGTTVAYNLSYVTLPVSVKMKTNEIGYMTYFAQLGLTPQINTGSRASSSDENLKKDYVSKEINLVNLSFFFGAGIEYGIGGQTAITAGLFFHNGITDILSSNGYKATLNFVTIRMGVMF